MKAGAGGLPPNGKNTASGFNKPYKGAMMQDPNRPGSAQIKQTRPFVSEKKDDHRLISNTFFIFIDSGRK